MDRYKPSGPEYTWEYFWHASPTVGVYTMGALLYDVSNDRRATHNPQKYLQVDEVSLDGREEELGVLTAHAREEAVLEEGRWHVVELRLETQERLLAAQTRARTLNAGAKGWGQESVW